MVALTSEADVKAVVAEAACFHTVANPERQQQVDGALFEDAGSNPVDDVVAATILDDDRVDAVPVEQVSEEQPGRACTDDSDLCSKAMKHCMDRGARRGESPAALAPLM